MEQDKIVHLDTHVLIWLYEGRRERLGRAARRALDISSPVASPAALLELQVLYETGKRRSRATELISALSLEIGLQICQLPFREIANQALHESWTRDPFDRLIVANARAASAALITKDARILDRYPRAIW
jgi:PIN domain nuclease of toxin-antitoxin system